MNKKIVAIVIVVFCVGTLMGYTIPQLLPKKTIYDKLREAQIIFSEGIWQEHYLQEAKNFQQIKNLEEFKQIYEVYFPLNNQPTGDLVQVKIDPDWNMIWICWSTVVSDVVSIEYLGFYFYSDPD